MEEKVLAETLPLSGLPCSVLFKCISLCNFLKGFFSREESRRNFEEAECLNWVSGFDILWSVNYSWVSAEFCGCMLR